MASERTPQQIDRPLGEAEEAITIEDWSTVVYPARFDTRSLRAYNPGDPLCNLTT